MRTLGSLVVVVVAVIIALGMGLPVLRDMNDGKVDLLTGGGPVSTMMAYVLLVPVILPLCRSVPGKALALLGATALSIGLGQAVSTLEAGDYLLFGLILAALAGAVGGVLVTVHRWRAHRRRQTLALSNDTSRLMSALADNLGRRHGGDGEPPRADDSLQQVRLVERLAFGVLAQAALEQEPRRFAETLIEGLADVLDSVRADRRSDPEGIAAQAAELYFSRVRGFLKSRGHAVRPPRALRRRPDKAPRMPAF
ncbi:hypothetical protein [Roseospirillum parvum]|uniref:5-bromo-4-chloroindolyl phosphate hydrolysis protein n=1 Tax=Roseospirillum parvum TaxID=83401 RepID=A0A1G7UEA0_9PROT|nr:hypothetical protein [Roseospirillum parvum]SDG45611.1 hypothetical protein SAMN05421742_101297 [Roseospirillum parvum]